MFDKCLVLFSAGSCFSWLSLAPPDEGRANPPPPTPTTAMMLDRKPLHGSSDNALYISKTMHRMTKKITVVVAQGILFLIRILGTGVQMIRNYEHDKIMTPESIL